MFRAVALFVCLFPTFSFGQISYTQLTQPITTFSYEDKDWAAQVLTGQRLNLLNGNPPDR